MKYEKLTKEQFEELHEEFAVFLAAQSIDVKEWTQIKQEKPELAEKELEIFSDFVWEKVLTKANYLDHFSPASLNLFKCGEDSIHRIVVKVNKEGVDLLKEEDFNWFLDNSRDPQIESFFGRQIRIATEYSGQIDPLDLEEYRAKNGFEALGRCLHETTPEQIIETVTSSGLRGRGGAGFPTGNKWRITRHVYDENKYIICNGDEGDPGAFMDRMILESYPFRVIEGMIIAAYAVGAHEGIFYIRAEYPLAVERVRNAISQCEKLL